MMNENLSFGLAFTAGIASFLSPCVLPLIPGYLSFLSGASIEQLKSAVQERMIRRRIFWNALFFVLGFSFVFILLGLSATGIGRFLAAKLTFFNKIAGVLIMLLGLHVMGFIRWDMLMREKKFEIRNKPFGWLGSFIVGATFAFGWTPCIGPILAGILALAGAQETVFQGMLLLAVYSLGLGIPFLATALGVPRFFQFFSWAKKWLRAVEIASGVLLMVVGFLIFTNRLARLAAYFSILNRFAL